MLRSKWTRLLAVLLALAMVAAACGSDDDGDEGAAADETTAETTAGDTEDEPAEAEGEDDSDALGNVEIDEEAASCATETESPGGGTYAPNGDFVNAISFAVNSLNPHDDQTPATFAYYTWIYEGLVRQAVDGSVEPWLAKCWETSDDGAQVTFFLHEGVTFHDGSPFNAEAVVANIEFIKSSEPPQVIPPVAGQLGIVDTVEAIDELTVQFNLAAPGEILLLSALIRNAGLMVAPAALGDAAANPVGTAPYAFGSANADFTEIDLVAYADYWQPDLVGLETVRLLSVQDLQARLDGFNAGQFDSTNLGVIQADQITRGGVSRNNTVRTGFVVSDWRGEVIPQLANRDVRCAMAQALNRDGLAAAAGDPDGSNAQFATGPDDYAYISDLAIPEFDIEAARAAFEATGEEAFSFSNGHLGTAGVFFDLSTGWATGLAELGITMENEALDPPSPGEMFVRLAEGRHPVQVIPFNEPNALMSLIARTGTGGFNPSGESPDGVVELVEAARGKNFEDGEADVAAAWKIMLEECVFIIGNTQTTVVSFGDGVDGVEHTKGIPVHFWPHGVTKS